MFAQSLCYNACCSANCLQHEDVTELRYTAFFCSILFKRLLVHSQTAVEAVERKMPKRLKRKRKIQTDDGLDAGMEEYYDYVFPEEAGAAPNLKLLEAAQAWKRRKQMESTEDGVL